MVSMKILKLLLISLILPYVYGCYDSFEVSDPVDNDGEITYAPEISSIEPTKVYFADTIEIRGQYFTATPGSDDYILFDTVKVPAVFQSQGKQLLNTVRWKNDFIQIVVPPNIPFGRIEVAVSIDDSLSNKVEIEILQPELPEIEMVEIPDGKFNMGDQAGNGFDNELPVHEVTLTRAFNMSKYEITQPQWKALINSNPSTVKADSLPVNKISWYEAVAFCNKLSEKHGFEKCYSGSGEDIVCDFDANGYRLPTEAEWEYAARAGTQTDYYGGNTESDLDRIAWWYGNIDFTNNSTSHPPGLKEPNDFGLYDIIGNVAEHCWDWWSVGYENADTLDPTGPDSGPGRVIRGGSWDSNANSCRVSFRYLYEEPDFHPRYAGFRIVRTK